MKMMSPVNLNFKIKYETRVKVRFDMKYVVAYEYH